jgi:aspartate kinase
MLELAALGAQVVHARAVELAEKYNVLLHVRSSFSDNPGTRIMSQPPGMEDVVVRAATLKPEVARVTFVGLPRADGLTAGVFNLIAGHNIIVDDIIQETYDQRRKVNISFTVDAAQVAAARAAADSAAERYGAAEVTVADDLARVSVVGVGMRSHSGVAARFFDALARENISIENVSTSEIVISVLVRRPDAERALQAVHRAFELDQA